MVTKRLSLPDDFFPLFKNTSTSTLPFSYQPSATPAFSLRTRSGLFKLRLLQWRSLNEVEGSVSRGEEGLESVERGVL